MPSISTGVTWHLTYSPKSQALTAWRSPWGSSSCLASCSLCDFVLLIPLKSGSSPGAAWSRRSPQPRGMLLEQLPFNSTDSTSLLHSDFLIAPRILSDLDTSSETSLSKSRSLERHSDEKRLWLPGLALSNIMESVIVKRHHSEPSGTTFHVVQKGRYHRIHLRADQ